MRLYNTLTQQKEEFAPAQDTVTMYVCGITPYDTTHLGHAFTYVVFDTLARTFQFKGWPVRYAQNVTDIDDDILRKANEESDDWKALGDRWTRRFIEDMDALNVLRPSYYPRATEEMARIIGMTRVVVAVISMMSTTPVMGARTTAAKKVDIPTIANAVMDRSVPGNSWL